MNVRVLLLPLIACGAAAAIWLSSRPPAHGDAPAATWRVGAGTEFRQARNYDELAPETPLRLSFSCGAPLHVYVFSHSLTDGTILLFPSPDVHSGLRNPLPIGRSVLPGADEGAELAWTTRRGVLGTTTFVVVAAEQPVPELEGVLPRLRRWSNRALQDHSMHVTNPRAGDETVGAPRGELPTPLLRRAAERSMTETVVNGVLSADSQLAGVWTSSFRGKETPQPPPERQLPK